MNVLHPALLVAGLVLGTASVLVGRRRPDLRRVIVPATVVVAQIGLVMRAGYGVATLGGAGVIVALVAVLVLVAPVPTRTRPYGALVSLGLPLIAAVYLSVPDTEGAVLLGAALLPVAVITWTDRWADGWRVLVAAGGSIALGVVTVAAGGGDGRISLSGWWVPKLVLAAMFLVLLVIFARSVRTTGPARPSP